VSEVRTYVAPGNDSYVICSFLEKNMNFTYEVTSFINRRYLLYALSVSFAFHYNTHTHSLLSTDKVFLTSNGPVR
jgi:hypothetical protein